MKQLLHKFNHTRPNLVLFLKNISHFEEKLPLIVTCRDRTISFASNLNGLLVFPKEEFDFKNVKFGCDLDKSTASPVGVEIGVWAREASR